jgi:hypothetical protein
MHTRKTITSTLLLGIVLLTASSLTAASIKTAAIAGDKSSEPKPLATKPLAPITSAPINERFAAAKNGEAPSFRRHVVPLLGKLGCNGRACHGSFQGRGGFRLSLFGYDFKMDHEQLTAKVAKGDDPRVNLRDPDASLILQKPTLRIPHEGGERYKLGSWEHHVLLQWIQHGAQPVKATDPSFVRLEVSPHELRFAKRGEKVSLKAVAHWSDGTREDVTPLCRFQSNDDQIATIDARGLVTSADVGDSHVVVFYDKGVMPVPVMRPVSSLVGNAYPQVSTPTEIDRRVVNKLRKLGIVPSELCTDSEFLRRTSFDLTGTLPTATEAAAFLADKSPDKRRKKVDDLLGRPSYAAWWTTRLCDITGNNDSALANVAPVDQRGSQEWYDWILKRVTANVPYDKIVEGIVLATSRPAEETYTDYAHEMSALYHPDAAKTYAERPWLTHFWARRTIGQPQQKALSFAYTFLGVRIQCAECHKHPFDQWTQDDYKDFTKFFNRVRYGIEPSDRPEYNQIVATFPVNPKRPNDLRQHYPKMLADGKTIPFDEVFIIPAQPRRPVQAERPQPNKKNRSKAAMAKSKEKFATPIAGRGAQTVTPAPKPRRALQVADAKSPRREATGRRPVVAQRPTKNKRRLARRQRQQPAIDQTTARLLGAEKVDLSRVNDPRVPLMKWLRSKKNPFFARAFVNRVWATYFNVGIVNPPDDLSLANPPSNAELLDYLAEGFIKHGYDMKWLHREIVNSRTYQLSWHVNDTNRLDQHNFSHAVLRRLPAEVAYDAVRQATASDARVAAMQHEWRDRAIGIPGSGRRGRGGSNYALNVFGRSVRQSNCDCDRSNDPSLLQTVFLRNDNEVLGMVNDPATGWLVQIASELAPPQPPAKPSKPKKPVTAVRPGSRSATIRPVVASRPVKLLAKNAPKGVPGAPQSGVKSATNSKPRDEATAVAGRIARLTQNIKELRADGKLDQADRLAQRVEELKKRPLASMAKRSQRNAARAGRSVPRIPNGGRLLALRLKPADVPAARKAQLIRTAYLRILTRYPDERESAKAVAYLNESDNFIGAFRDLVWALVNTREFIVNH